MTLLGANAMELAPVQSEDSHPGLAKPAKTAGNIDNIPPGNTNLKGESISGSQGQ